MRPPEKPAKKWGSMNPSATSRSASTTIRLRISCPPEGSVPIQTISDSSQSWTTIRSRSTNSCPNFAASSSLVVPLWQPVAMRMVISAAGFPLRISRSRTGIIILLGTGRVWSLAMTTTCRFPAASSASGLLPMGCITARSTSSSSVASGTYWASFDSRTLGCRGRSAEASRDPLP